MKTRSLMAKQQSHLLLFLSSFVALYFELVIIRYLSAEIRIFAYLMNLSLVASFAGLGLGMILGGPPKWLMRAFPVLAATLVLVIAYAGPLHLTHLPFPQGDYLVFSNYRREGLTVLSLIFRYCIATLSILTLIVGFFTVLGGIVGQQLETHKPLSGYCTNLAGSLAGVLTFTVVSFLGMPPVVWLVIGVCAALPFFYRKAWVILTFAVVLVAVTVAQRGALWSPYYRITMQQLPSPIGWERPSAYLLSVNHDYHQKVVDLSDRFESQHPEAEPNRSARLTYDLPYKFVASPRDVLVIGAGTGNDVAAALRHGAMHVDAVEIDPVILKLGRKYHPEQPYSSDRVSVFVDDARAFFKKSAKKYDLVVFAYLDAHTMLTSFSSVRLDNYVYTVESFRAARNLLAPGGTMVVAFASGKTFITERLFEALGDTFGGYPRVYYSGYDGHGVVFIHGPGSGVGLSLPEMSANLLPTAAGTVVPTDNWPFLYLSDRTIPLSILFVIVPFMIGCAIVFDRLCKLSTFGDSGNVNLFFLGAGFLLLETSAVTRLSLLFGSTWVVNAVVIASFISMALLANLVVMFIRISYKVAYAALFLLLLLNILTPYSALDSLPNPLKVVCAAVIVGLPVFLSGMLFSRGLSSSVRPSAALGMNLLGAVVGGLLENAVMIGGTRLLGVLAVLVYAFSAIALLRGVRAREHAVQYG